MDIGLILRKKLDDVLLESEDQIEDYGHFKFLQDKGHNVVSYTPDSLNLDELKKKDFVFYFMYPFNRELSSYLSRFENDIFFINPPSKVLLSAPKTFEPNYFQEHLPEHFIYSNNDVGSLKKFLSKEKDLIIKPIEGTGGKGIVFFDKFKPVEEKLKDYLVMHSEYPQGYICEEFIENDGDKRVIVFNGDVLGSIGRVNKNTYVNNISSGGNYANLPLSSKEEFIVCAVAKKLKNMGVYFAGLDILSNHLIEVNTSAPGCTSIVKPLNVEAYDVLEKFHDNLMDLYESKKN
ncbi:ATP-grasp domain-containing protein [Candidatus Woesearchaeota archaeon]|nr:ATP-grasp domain-containing protein [Candidatus Woesearchaeota archaeon]